MSLAHWIAAARPRTFPAAMAPVAVGTAVAWHEDTYNYWPALISLLGALFIQIGANFANDLGDFRQGADSVDRVGPTRATSAGLISPTSMRNGVIAAFAAAMACGFYLVTVAGWPVVAIGLTSILAALLYTGGPTPYGYRGLGELFVFVFFGLVAVAGTFYVQALRVSPGALLAGVPIGLLCANILVVNNIRDRQSDARAGKRTLAVLFGRGPCLAMYGCFLALAYVAVMVGIALRWYPISASITLLTAPFADQLAKRVASADGRDLNPLLGETAMFELMFAVVFTIGILIPT
jgi:1,4-dihydroxy-2-naphthoate octaprenyltransferase